MIAAVSAADQRAYCLAQPGANAADCERAVQDHMVGGVYCDGAVYLEAGKPPRCIPRAQLDAKRAAELAHPLPTPPASTNLWVIGGVALAVAVAAYFVVR